MPYVERDIGNAIVGRYNVAQPGRAEEFLAENDPEILALALVELKQEKRADFLAEGVTRIAAQVPDWDTLDTIKTVAGLWVSHLATNATAAQLVAKDIYIYVRDTVPAKLAALTTQAQLDATDPTAADPFGDGTPWPT